MTRLEQLEWFLLAVWQPFGFALGYLGVMQGHEHRLAVEAEADWWDEQRAGLD